MKSSKLKFIFFHKFFLANCIHYFFLQKNNSYIMSDRIIVYASKYGSTRRYAEELGMLMGVDFMNYRHIRHLNSYGEVIYMGAIFAGRVLGLKKTMRRLSDFSGKRVSVITVGLADLHDEGNVSHIRAMSANRCQTSCSGI